MTKPTGVSFSLMASNTISALPVIVAISTVSLGLILYRLLLHPLSHFPGPRLAAITVAYAGWYDVIQKGQLVEHLERLHQRYGRCQETFAFLLELNVH